MANIDTKSIMIRSGFCWKFPALNNEVEGEAASAGAGSGANLQPTPMGLVPTSPLASTAVMQGL